MLTRNEAKAILNALHDMPIGEALKDKDLINGVIFLSQHAAHDPNTDEVLVRVHVLRSDNKVAAIKAVREMTYLGLKEAKDLVDKWWPAMLSDYTPAPFAIPLGTMTRGDFLARCDAADRVGGGAVAISAE